MGTKEARVSNNGFCLVRMWTKEARVSNRVLSGQMWTKEARVSNRVLSGQMWTKEARVSNYGFCLVRCGPKRLGFLTMGSVWSDVDERG